MATGDISSASVSADGTEVSFSVEGMNGGEITGFEEGLAAWVSREHEGYSVGTTTLVNTAETGIGTAFRSASGSNPATVILYVDRPLHDDDSSITLSVDADAFYDGAARSNAAADLSVNNAANTRDYHKVKVAQRFEPYRRETGSFKVQWIAFGEKSLAHTQARITDSGDASSGWKTASLVEVSTATGYGSVGSYWIYEVEFVPGTDTSSDGLATVEIEAYPGMGDADSVYDTTSETEGMHSDTLRVWIDADDSEADDVAVTGYVDSTYDVGIGGITGAFQDRELCLVEDSGDSIVGLVYPIGDQTGSPGTFKFNHIHDKDALATNSLPSFRSITFSGTPTTTPEAGWLLEVPGNPPNKQGVFVKIEGSTLYYMGIYGSHLSDTETIRFWNPDDWTDEDNEVTATADSVEVVAIHAHAISDTDIITGLTSGATCTASGDEAANGDDTNSGLTVGSPTRTIMEVMRKVQNARSDGSAHHSTVKLAAGDYCWGPYSFGDLTQTDEGPLTITPQDGLAVTDVRITHRGTGDGVRTEAIKILNLSVWEIGSGALSQGSASTPDLLVVEGCIVRAMGLGARNFIFGSGYQQKIVFNSVLEQMSTAEGGQVMWDSTIQDIGADALSSWRQVINVAIEGIFSVGTFHSDVDQISANTENTTRYLVRAPDNYTQGAPFLNQQSNVGSIGYLNCIFETTAGSVLSAQIHSMEIEDLLFVNCTLQQPLILRDDAATLTIGAMTFVNCYLEALTSGGDLTEDDIKPAWFPNCHIRNSDNGGGDSTASNLASHSERITTGGSNESIFVQSSDQELDTYLAPKSGGELDGGIPTGDAWFSRDLYGNSVPNNGLGAVGALQLSLSSVPIPVVPSFQSPVKFSASPSLTSVSLSWIDRSSTEVSFNIERSLSSISGFVEIATVGKNITNYIDSSVSLGTTYYYKIRAFDGSNYSNYSSIATAIMPRANVPAHINSESINRSVVLQEVNGFILVPGIENYYQNSVTINQVVAAIEAELGLGTVTVSYSNLATSSNFSRTIIVEYPYVGFAIDVYQIIRDLV